MENKEQLYVNNVKAKVDELAKLCYQYNLPCFLAIAVGDKKPKTKAEKESSKTAKLDLKVTTYLPEMLYVETEDTVFSDFINVMNGFTTVPPNDRSNFAIDADALALPPDLEIEE